MTKQQHLERLEVCRVRLVKSQRQVRLYLVAHALAVTIMVYTTFDSYYHPDTWYLSVFLTLLLLLQLVLASQCTTCWQQGKKLLKEITDVKEELETGL